MSLMLVQHCADEEEIRLIRIFVGRNNLRHVLQPHFSLKKEEKVKKNCNNLDHCVLSKYRQKFNIYF